MRFRPVLVLALLAAACNRDISASSRASAPTPLPATDGAVSVADASAADASVIDAAPPDAAPAPQAQPPSPTPSPRVDPMFACRRDGDCALIWLGRGCVRSDPKAVARARLGDAQRKFSKGPPRACGMGGPDYEARVREVELRYGATCKSGVCTLVDRGPQRSLP
jgi:hypothetical protein